MLRIKLQILTLAGLVLFIGGCNNPFPGFKKTKEGLYYKFHVKGDCDAFAQPGDMVSFDMRLYTEDSVYTEATPVMQQKMDTSLYTGDLYAALGMMCEGDSATFILSSDSLAKHYGLALELPEGSFLHIDLGMKKIETTAQIEAKEDSMITAELEFFEKYRTDSLEGFTELAPGVLFKETLAGKGGMITDTSMISLKLTGTTLGGKMFFPEEEKAFNFRIMDDNGIPFNWNDALRLMKEGSQGTLVLTSSNAFGKRGLSQGLVGSYESIKLELNVVKVSASAKEFEQFSINDYLKTNKIKEKPGKGGMVYIVQEKGEGALLKSKDKVKVHYVGFYLDNMGVFDSSRQRGEPMDVIIDETEVIKGWHQALKMMRVGEKARFIIPSSLAYGQDGYPPVIGPYAPLIFDLEVVEKL
jgi:FKBP-type peptidyl-prolyl cis-trans isomerase